MEWIEDDDVVNILPFPFKMKKSFTSYNKKRAGFYLKIY